VANSVPPSLRVLIVDDDMVSMLVAEHILRNAGHVVVTASNADEARATLQAGSESIDVVLCDYHMPGQTGLDLLASLMEKSGEVPPFILLTGVGEADELDDDRVTHVTGFLTKPVQSNALVRAVVASTVVDVVR